MIISDINAVALFIYMATLVFIGIGVIALLYRVISTIEDLHEWLIKNQWELDKKTEATLDSIEYLLDQINDKLNNERNNKD